MKKASLFLQAADDSPSRKQRSLSYQQAWKAFLVARRGLVSKRTAIEKDAIEKEETTEMPRKMKNSTKRTKRTKRLRKQPNSKDFNRLPPEMKVEVLRHLPEDGVLTAGQTSSGLRAAAQSACLWKHSSLEFAASKYFDPDVDRWVFEDGGPKDGERERVRRVLLFAPRLNKLTVRATSTVLATVSESLQVREGPLLKVNELHLECVSSKLTTGRFCHNARSILRNVTGMTTITVFDITAADLCILEEMPTLKDLTVFYFRMAEREGGASFPLLSERPGRAVCARLQRLVLGRYCPSHVLLGLLCRHQHTLQELVCWGSELLEMQALSRCAKLREVAVGPGPHLHELAVLRRLRRLTLDVSGHPELSRRCETLRQAAPYLAELRFLERLQVKCGCRRSFPVCPGRVLEPTIHKLKKLCSALLCSKDVASPSI